MKHLPAKEFIAYWEMSSSCWDFREPNYAVNFDLGRDVHEACLPAYCILQGRAFERRDGCKILLA